MVTVRPAETTDAATWLEMRCALWPEGSEAEHRDEIDCYLKGQPLREPWVVLVAADCNGRLLGFTELSIRPYAEGCRTNRVAYLEGWYVCPEVRGQGVGKALVSASEDWGRSQGCTEFASDTDPDNEISASAHRALGFTDVGLVRCFMKRL